MDIWGSLISALVGQLISLMMPGLGGEGGNRHLTRAAGHDRPRRRRSYVEVRVTWGRASW